MENHQFLITVKSRGGHAANVHKDRRNEFFVHKIVAHYQIRDGLQ